MKWGGFSNLKEETKAIKNGKGKTKKNKLSQKEYEALELRFGLKDGKKRTIVEISKILELSQPTISQKINNAIKKLEQDNSIWYEWNNDKEKLDIVLNSGKICITKDTQTNYTRDYFFSQFKGHSKEEVFWAFLNLTEISRLTIYNRHGKNLNEVIKLDKNGKKTATQNYYNTIHQIRKYLVDKNFKSFIKKYPKEEFEPFLTILTQEELEAFTLFHGKNYDEHKIGPYDEKHTIKDLIDAYFLITNKLKTEILKNRKKTKKQKSQKIILTEREYKALELRFGLKDGKKRTITEISEILEVSKPTVSQRINNAINKLEQDNNIWYKWNKDKEKLDIVLNNKKENIANDFFSQFKEYSKEEVFWTLIFIANAKRNVVFTKFGENLDTNLPWPKEASCASYYSATYSCAKKDIQNILNGNKKVLPFIKKYPRVEFELQLIKLTQEERDLFTLFHGENYDELKLVSYNEKYTIKNLIDAYLELTSKLEMTILEEQKNSKSIKKKETNISSLKPTEQKEPFFSKFEGEAKEDVLWALSNLRENPRQAIYNRHGKNLNEVIKLDKDGKSTANQNYYNAIAQIKKRLAKKKDLKLNSNKEVAEVKYDFLDKLGCTYEIAKEAVAMLPLEEQKIVHLRRGESLLEFNFFPKDKPIHVYKKLEADAIYHVKENVKIIKKRQQVEEEKNSNLEVKQKQLEQEKKKLELQQEKLNLMKASLFEEISKKYSMLISEEQITAIINNIVKDTSIFKIIYLSLIETQLFLHLSKFYKKNLDSEPSLQLLNKLKEMYTTKMKAKYPLLKKEEIEKVIEEQLISYNGERKFEDEIARHLRKSY